MAIFRADRLMPSWASIARVRPSRSLELQLGRLLGDQVAVDRVGGVDVGVAEPFRQLIDRPSRLQRDGH